MAQVRKFSEGTNNGGVTAQPDLFEWEGVGEYERKPMVQTLTKNLAAYADHLGLTGERRTRFLNNGAAAIKALEAGNIRRLSNGSYEDISKTMSSTGKYDKNWLGKLKDTDNNAYNDVAGYFNTYLGKASVYDPEKVKKEAEEKANKDKVKFGGDAYLRSALAKALYAGNFSEDDWFNHRTAEQRNAALADVFRNADYSDIYGKYLWDDTGIDSAETLRQKGLAFAEAIGNNNPEDLDYNTAAALGISNLRGFLEKQEQTPATPTYEDQQAVAKEEFFKAKRAEGFNDEQIERLWANQQNAAAREREAVVANSDAQEAAAQRNAEWEDWYSQHNRPDTSKLAAAVYGDTTKFTDDSVLDIIQKQYKGNTASYYNDAVRSILGEVKFRNNSGQMYSDRDQQIIALRRLRHAAENVPNYFGQALPTGEYVLPGTLRDDYVAYVYNPSNNSYRQVNLLANEAYKDYVRNLWNPDRTQSNKQGGVLKMQYGGYTDYQKSLQEGREAANAWYQNAYADREEKRKAEKQAKRQPDPLKVRDYTRTGDQIEAGKRQIGGSPAGEYEWSTTDKIRLGTIGADVLSTIASFVPGYGTAASAILGVGSTLTNFGTDAFDDSVSAGQMWSNLGIGLGMDIVGLIPGAGVAGKAGKIARLLRPISKGLLWTLRGIGTVQAFNSMNAINKLMTTPDKMTVDDWRDVAGGVQAAMGLANYRAGKRAVSRNTTEKQVVDIHGADRKKYTISQEDYEKLRSTQGKEAQDKLFKELTGSQQGLTREIKDNKKVPLIGWSIPGTGNNPGHSRTELHWMDAPDAPRWAGWSGYNKGDKAFIDFYHGNGSTTARRPNKPSSSKQTPKKRIQSLAEGDTRVKQGNNVVRTGKLTDAEIKQINKNRKAAGKQPLTKQEIDAINARAANNASTQAPTLQERVQQRRYDREHSVDAEVARARAELRRPVTAASAPRVVADQTVPARMGLQDFINTSIPGRPVTGAARNARQSMYDNLFQAVPQARVVPARPVSPTVPKAPTAKQHAARQKALDEAFKAGPDPKAVIAANTKRINTSVQKLIDSKLPKRPSSGAARQKRQKALEEVLGPVQKKDNRKTATKKAAKTKAAKKKSADRDKKLASMGGAYKLGGRLIRRFDIGGSVDPYTGVTWNDERMMWVKDEKGNLKLVPRETFSTTTNGMRYKPEFDATALEGTAGYKAYNQALETNDDLLIKWLEDAVKYRKDDSDTRLLQFKDKKSGKWDLTKVREALFRGNLYGNNGPGRLDTNAGVLHDVTKGQNYYYLDGDTKKYLGAVPKGYKATDQFTWSDDNLVKHILLEKVADTPKPAPTGDTSSRAGEQNPETQQDTSSRADGTTAVAGERGKKGSGKGWNLLPEDVLAFSRMAMGLGANARAAEQQKAGLKPLLTDTWENVVSPEYDYIGDREAFDAKARLTSFAGRTRTANSQDQFAGELEAENKGNQLVAQQKVRSANRFYQTDRLRQQESDAAKARRVENANANMGRMLQTDAAKHQIDAALTTAQYAQVIAPWMAGIENQYRQNRAMQRQMDASAYQRSLMAQMQTDYDAAKAAGDTKKMQEITDKYQADIEAYNKRMYSSPWLIQKTMQSPTSSEFKWIDYAKQGGRLTAREREVIQRAKDFNKRMLEDNKQFHKDIMESKREHNKLIAGMSNLTADLIKNGMKWK